GGTPPAAGASQRPAAQGGTEGGEPVLPARSPDDEDTGWGDASSGNEERLIRDVPPHW
ncbi:hypothetical protein ICW40_16465, partial [Actinotalea ferrariae]|nr:hypothetical protein [Actinotalea ferrariae]